MSRPARGDKVTGRLLDARQAAQSGNCGKIPQFIKFDSDINALPLGHRSGWSAPQGRDVEPRRGDIIRACARIAAGSGSRSCQQGKGLRNKSNQYVILPEPWPAVAFGLTPALFPHFPRGGLLSLRRAAADAVPHLPGVGRQPLEYALQHAVDALKHSTLRIASRRPTPPRLRLRDLKAETSRPSVVHEDDRKAFRDVEKTGVVCE